MVDAHQSSEKQKKNVPSSKYMLRKELSDAFALLHWSYACCVLVVYSVVLLRQVIYSIPRRILALVASNQDVTILEKMV